MESLDDTPRSVPMPIIDIKGNLLFGDKLGSGIGVVGASRYGTGVHGASQKARGGVFESGVGAQINLKPLFERATPPKDGQTGDLVVITKMKEDHPTSGELAELWVCVRGPFHNESAIWGKIQFSEFTSF